MKEESSANFKNVENALKNRKGDCDKSRQPDKRLLFNGTTSFTNDIKRQPHTKVLTSCYHCTVFNDFNEYNLFINLMISHHKVNIFSFYNSF